MQHQSTLACKLAGLLFFLLDPLRVYMLCSRAEVVWHIYSHMYKHPGMYVYVLRRIQRHLSKSPARPPAGRQETSDPLWDMKTLPHVSPHSWTVVIRTCCPDSQVQQTEGESPWGENTVGAVTVAVLLAVQLAGWLYGWLADWFSCSRCSSQRIKVQQMQSFSVWAKDDKCLANKPLRTHIILSRACAYVFTTRV